MVEQITSHVDHEATLIGDALVLEKLDTAITTAYYAISRLEDHAQWIDEHLTAEQQTALSRLMDSSRRSLRQALREARWRVAEAKIDANHARRDEFEAGLQ